MGFINHLITGGGPHCTSIAGNQIRQIRFCLVVVSCCIPMRPMISCLISMFLFGLHLDPGRPEGLSLRGVFVERKIKTNSQTEGGWERLSANRVHCWGITDIFPFCLGKHIQEDAPTLLKQTFGSQLWPVGIYSFSIHFFSGLIDT